MWIGTFFGGINYLPQHNADFRKYYHTDSPRSLKGLRVREICPDNKGKLWVGTEDAGLYHFDPENHAFEFMEASRDFSNVHALMMHGDYLWVSAFSKGIRVIDTRTGRIRVVDTQTTQGDLFSNYVFALCKSRNGRIYIGTMHGLQYYDLSRKCFSYIPRINDGKMVNDIREDSEGNLWVATFSNGAYRYNPLADEWSHFVHDAGNENSLPCNNVTSIFEDADKRIWLTTEGAGFCCFDPETQGFSGFNSGSGLPSDVVFQIVEDDRNLFWITTNHGLVAFDPREGRMLQTYTVANHLLSNQFNYKSSCKTPDGSIYFGCIEGMIAFDPQKLSDRSNELSPVYITDFSLSDTGKRGLRLPLEKSIVYCDSIHLKHNQNTFSLQLSVLSYQNASGNRLSYKLDGFDEHWVQSPPNGITLTYSKLPPGKYTLRVQLTNGTRTRHRELYIRIAPPFYLSKVACLVYALLAAGSLYGMVSYQNRSRNAREMQRRKSFEERKERELYDVKIRFFTNIAHEIRTPLTLIKLPLENILTRKKVGKELYDDLDIMKHNTDRLLDLTNQLLDFQKIEKKHLTLDLVPQDVAKIVKETLYRFSSTVRQQNKSFDLELRDEEEPIRVAIDKEAFTKVLSNLLVNALNSRIKRSASLQRLKTVVSGFR